MGQHPLLSMHVKFYTGHEMLVQLVHEAHENGLICYVSAGIEDKHVPDAVIAGVDGIGIGN